MDSLQFAFWLKGFFELSDSNKLTQSQVKMIKDHLDLVFTKVTPTMDEIQREINDSLHLPLCNELTFDNKNPLDKKASTSKKTRRIKINKDFKFDSDRPICANKSTVYC